MRRKKFVPIPEAERPEDKIDTRSLTLDEIEEIRRKRERNKREREDGEIDDEDDEDDRSKRKSKSKRDRSPSYRHPEGRHRSPPRRERDRYGYRDFRDYRRRSRDRVEARHRRRSRSRSRSRSRDRGFRGSRSAIDKAKLLAIAQKNAVKLLNSNDLKGMDKGRLVAIKSGGQSLSELTFFCRELARKGITDEFSDDGEGLDSDEETRLNHPFEVKDRPVPNPFLLGLTGLRGASAAPKNALTLSSMTPAMRDAARGHRLSEFPVSSGNAHRVKEADITLEEDIQKIPTGIVAAQKAVTSLANSDDPVLKILRLDPPEGMVKLPPLPDQLIQRKIEVEKKSPEDEKEQELSEAQKLNLSNPLGVIMFGGHLDPPLAIKGPEEVPTPVASTPPSKQNSIPAQEMSPHSSPKSNDNSASDLLPSASSSNEAVFEPIAQPSQDIGAIIGIRLNAMKRLSSNPNDPVALKELYDAQHEMTNWAASKNKPGQFTGHTGARVLSKGELMTGVQAWARNDQFTRAQKVSGGFGEYMLRKMGWREGEGLGKDRSGDVDPLQLDIKMDKKGLISAEEMVGRGKVRGEALTLTGLKDMSGKHPVTAIMEVATRRKWGAPTFTQVFECGQAHKKQFIWKCTVNGVDYQPTIASDNKKKAKLNAALVALQDLGLMPKDPNNPL